MPEPIPFGVQVVHFEHDLHSGRWLPMCHAASWNGHRTDPDVIPLQRQVGKSIRPTIGDQRESEQINVEPDCRIQICREDLKTQAG